MSSGSRTQIPEHTAGVQTMEQNERGIFVPSMHSVSKMTTLLKMQVASVFTKSRS